MEAAIFDFDFTLADSSLGIIECVNWALRGLQIPTAPSESIIETIGLPLADTFRRLTQKDDSQLVKEFAKRFHARADHVMDAMTQIYGPVRPVMGRLRKAGLSTAIVSTKLNYRIREILLSKQLTDLFDVIVGADDVAHSKPDPEGLLMALRQLRVNPDSAVYVGDHVVDAVAASNAGMQFVAVLTGRHRRDAFGAYRHLAILDSIEDLPRVLSLN